MRYVYKGINMESRKAIKGSIEADDEREAKLLLRNRKINVTDIKRDWKSIEIKFRREKIKVYDTAVASRQLAAMISAGLPLARALDILAGQVTNRKLRKVFRDVSEDIAGGSSFYEALNKYKEHFGDLYISMIRSGEESGALDDILNRLALYQEKSVALRRKVKGALAYPITIIIFAAIILAIIMVFVVPKLAEVYESLGGELPVMTQITINVSNFVASPTGGGIILLSVILLVMIIRLLYKRTVRGRYFFDFLLLKLPKFGDLVNKLSIARFSRSMSTLLRGGVPILRAIDITASNSGNKVVEKYILNTKADIEEGRTLAEPMRQIKLFPSMVVEMVRVGEETGNLDDMMDKVADYYEDEVDRAVEAVTSMILPVFIFFLGGIIGFIVISLYLPIFKMGELVR
ncbi:MAG: type II secretion system F family protein [Deferribacterota bacterium]|nr:type II secretion system F family protein [Deferribacterota bacterium]